MRNVCGTELPRIAVSPSELAIAIGRAESTVRAWMRDQGLPYSRIGGCVLIHLAQFERWLFEHQEGPTMAIDLEVDQIVDGVFKRKDPQ